MSEFIVSARKYRPATFESVVGQQSITSTLKNAIERGQLAHAYLFCGPRGVGKTTCARIFAKTINCLSPNGSEACNECESCRAFNEGRSLNIHELDAASNNSVDDIRTLIEQVRILPQVGRYSLYIIDEVHMLSQQAFNAFLKTLEEPPCHAIFILATTEKHKIIPTILSRCQVYDFNRIRVEDSVRYLKYIAQKEGVQFDEESLNLIAQKADGGMRDALSMFDKAVSFCGSALDYHSVAHTLNVLDYDTYFGITDLLTAGRYAEALIAFDEVLARGFSGQTFMAGLNRHLRDLLMAKRPDTLSLIEMTGALLERYRVQAEACDPEFLFGAIAILTELDGKIRQASNGRLLVELGLMKIARLGQKKKDDVGSDEEYLLPELTPPVAPATTPTQTPITPPVQPRPTATEQPATPKVETPKVEAPKDATATASTPAQPQAAAPRRISPLGASLSSLLAAQQAPHDETHTEDTAKNEQVFLDPMCAEKIEAARSEVLDWIREQRPRFAPTFEQMTLENSTIRLSVPSRELHDEILRNKTLLLTGIARVAKVNGSIELEVAINEQLRAARPIKLEDRVKFLSDKNPLLNELRRQLDMEVE